MKFKLRLDKLFIDWQVMISLYFNLYRAVKNKVIFNYGFCFCIDYVFLFFESCQLLFDNELSDKTLILTIFILTINAFVTMEKKIQTQLWKGYDLFRLAFMFSFLIIKIMRNRRMTRKNSFLMASGFLLILKIPRRQ